MKQEIQSIIRNLRETLSGEPWFGRPVFAILHEVDISKVYDKPNDAAHSLIELLYHMNTWAEFTLKRIEKDTVMDLVAFEKLDWRTIDPKVHRWEEGVTEFTNIHKKIIDLLETKEDNFLEETVDYRKYNFRFLLNGLVQHNIYHLGQLAYLAKILA